MTSSPSSGSFEEKLYAATRLPQPRPEFLAGLRARLAEEAQSHPEPLRPVSFGARIQLAFRRPAWVIAVIVILLLAGALGAIGPQRVLAQVQRLLNYVPGIGFVDLKQARILAAPVSFQREGVTLKVGQALAEPDRTLVVFSSQGLPAESQDYTASRFENLPVAVLRLPDGSVLDAVRQELSYGGGKIEFPALPDSIYQVTFEIDRLPLLPPGAGPENWQAPLLFIPASDELPADLFPQPYAPADAIATANGVTARILQVVQTAEETALQVQFKWENPGWEFRAAAPPFELRDELGNVYWQFPSNAQVASAIAQESGSDASSTQVEEPATSTSETTFRFPALSLAAHEAVLHLPSIRFSVPDSTRFTFDPGSDPQIGQTWELDTAMYVAGIPLDLTEARLLKNDQTYPDEPPLYSFEFTFRSSGGLLRSLDGFFLETDLESYRGGGGGMREPGLYKVEMLFNQLPQQPLSITFEGTTISVHGPWEIRWQIPSTGEAAPITHQMSPVGIEDTQAGVTLQLEQVIINDQVTVVNLTAQGLPDGGQLLNVLAFDPSNFDLSQGVYASESQLYLETIHGQRVELAQNVSWQPEGEAQNDPGRLVLGSLPLQAERVTLRIPAVELFLPGQAAFEIEVPEDMTFHSEAYKVPAMGRRTNGQQETTQIRWVSDPWEVDIPVEVAGYRLHFTQAQVEQDRNAKDPYRLILTSEPISRAIDGKYLSALNLSAITRPDGQWETSAEINEMMRWFGLLYDRLLTENYDPSNWKAKIILDVTAADGLAVLPGRYRVEIDGLTAWVSGPWELSWPLSSH